MKSYRKAFSRVAGGNSRYRGRSTIAIQLHTSRDPYPFIACASSNCTIISALGAIATNGTPIGGRNYDFLSDLMQATSNCDKREAVIMEMGLTKSCLRKSEEGMLVAFNVFLTFIAEEIKPPEPAALGRHDFARKCFNENKGKVDERFMRELLSDHSIPIRLHNEINTLRSVITKTNERNKLVADGHPCTSKFEKILILT